MTLLTQHACAYCSECFEADLPAHLKRCPSRHDEARLQAQPWYHEDINAGLNEVAAGCDGSEQPVKRLATAAERSQHSYELGVSGMRTLFQRVRHAAAQVYFCVL